MSPRLTRPGSISASWIELHSSAGLRSDQRRRNPSTSLMQASRTQFKLLVELFGFGISDIFSAQRIVAAPVHFGNLHHKECVLIIQIPKMHCCFYFYFVSCRKCAATAFRCVSLKSIKDPLQNQMVHIKGFLLQIKYIHNYDLGIEGLVEAKKVMFW